MGPISQTIMKPLSVVALFLLLSCQQDPMLIVVEQHARVFEASEPDPDRSYANLQTEKNRTIATVTPGETMELLDTEYKKDYAAYRVRLKDGRVGYLLSDVRFKPLISDVATSTR
jgi:hypothetical protein